MSINTLRAPGQRALGPTPEYKVTRLHNVMADVVRHPETYGYVALAVMAWIAFLR